MQPLRPWLILGCAVLAATPAAAQLSGTYTINPAFGSTPRNFVSFEAAVAALDAQGVLGPVDFEVFDDAGPYTGARPFTGLFLGNGQAAVVLGAWAGTSANTRVRFAAAPGEAPVIDATGQAVGVWWNGADFVTLEGLEIRGADQDAIAIYAAAGEDARGNELRRLLIHSCGGVGIYLHGNGGVVQDTRIENCVLHTLLTNSLRGINSSLVRDGYVSGRRHSGTSMIHNTIVMNSAAGFVSTYAIGDNSDAGTGFTQIEGNLVSKSAGTFLLRFENPAILPTVSNRNLFFDASAASFARLGTTSLGTFQAWRQATARDIASSSTDPQLAGSPVAFRLTATSPAIGLVSGPTLVPFDIDLAPRDASPDCGADEWTGSTPQFQVNTPEAELSIDGLLGSSDRAAVRTVGRGAPLVLRFGSTTGFGWESFIKPFPVLTTRLGAQISPSGQIVNLDLLTADGFFVRGGPVPNYAGGLAASFSYTRFAPVVPGDWSMQSQHLDPAAPDGWRMSQPAQISVR